MSDVIHGL